MEDTNVAKVVIISLSAATNIALNCLLIVVIARTPTLRDDRTTLFVFSLVSSDLAFGCSVMVSSAIVCSRPDIRVGNFAYVFAVVGYWLNLTSLYNLCCISVCKMVAVVYPLRYLTLVTERRCHVVIVFNWLFSLVMTAPLFAIDMSWNPDLCFIQPNDTNSSTPHYVVAMQMFGNLVPIAVMVYANVRMFYVVAYTTRRVSAEGVQVGVGSSSLVLQQHTLASVMLRSIRSSRNIIVMCLAYTVVVIMAIMVESISWHQKSDSPDVKFVALWLFFNNTSINSFLYISLYRSVRKAIKKLCRVRR